MILLSIDIFIVLSGRNRKKDIKQKRQKDAEIEERIFLRKILEKNRKGENNDNIIN